VAEDDARIAFLLQETMEEAGFEVTVAPDGAAALSCFERACWDILITDTRMPGMSGIELVRAIRRAGSEIPVVVLSGYFTPTDASELRALGVADDAILEKPTSLLHVAETVLGALRKRDQFATLAA
jgi:DNA-binding response OmpR family regulator